MKHLPIAFVALAMLIACNNEKKTDDKMSGDNKDGKKESSSVTYPYTPRYSSQFSMGKDENAQNLLMVWKAWDNNKLNDAKPYFADTVEMFLADNTHMKLPVDSFLAAGNSMRAAYPQLHSELDAWLPLHATEKNEDWVLIWGVEIRTDKNGVTDSSGLHEVWRVNKDGKFDQFFQYEQKLMPPPPAPKNK